MNSGDTGPVRTGGLCIMSCMQSEGLGHVHDGSEHFHMLCEDLFGT